ncbi:HU family DNA-binding protein [uncultured Bacteroides sp.]|uniref:HU family DNA-binding protein n=1 Tax=uncultured Bacteroides sp. TaxID=162156 RepID=UPI002AAAFEB2|nr:HU family DNA-binding protein [uncultured Bacteroides sp.]
MAFRYRVKTKRPALKDKEVKYYAVPIRNEKVQIYKLAEELTKRCSLTKGDILSTLVGLVDLMEEHLHNGDSVCLDNLGIFTLSATSDGFDSPEECTPSKVRAQKICFRADNKLKKNLQFVKFEKDKHDIE